MGPVIGGRSPCAGIVALAAGRTLEQPGVESRISVTGATCDGQRAKIVVDVTLVTGQPGMRSGQRKTRERVIERSRQPAIGGVTGTAICTKATVVGVILRMTGTAVDGRIDEHIIDMTTGAWHAGMLTRQLEAGQVVIESGWQPAASGVTGAAISAELTVMGIVLGVAGIAVAGRAFEVIIDMASGAWRADMLTGQLEAGQVVVKRGWRPACGRVTGAAIWAELTVMGIVFCMTGIAVAGRAFEDFIDMAIGAGDANMLTGQFETGQVVIEGGGGPTCSGVASATIRA
jgi:hypothetical protein